MSSRKRKPLSKQAQKRERNTVTYIFSRCRNCGKMVNNELDSYTVTAAMDIFCEPCYYDIGWQNIKKNYENYREPRELPVRRYKNDSGNTS